MSTQNSMAELSPDELAKIALAFMPPTRAVDAVEELARRAKAANCVCEHCMTLRKSDYQDYHVELSRRARESEVVRQRTLLYETLISAPSPCR